ncbi:MAG TPA: UDP-3-O-(3-hydroxymyristoyl)glucosamine N-acyltransferase [Verrucomicrobiae bacterium]|jgi:UDP-3-O-[3-hydroxymyristoyl] glucosamine N-acyltransferase|nr:UDP-3-O-(3-hydroxymyristoyl)glucosamine N-acyltransferase [Verrucomicrobiae bacterium]
MPFTAAEIAKQLAGQVRGDASVVLTGFAPAESARAGDLTFAENETYFQRAEASAASAILVTGNFNSERKTLIAVPNARIAFARVLPLFFPDPVFAPGVHPSAVVAADAKIDPTAHIGPNCIVGAGAQISARVVLQGGNSIGFQSQLGEETQLFPNVTIYPRTQIGKRVRIHSGSVIGSDGFGYVFDQGVHRKVPQIGNVIIGDDVEIGACVTVDRGALGPTTIGKGSKIDNLVQIAHNVAVGEHCLLVSQVGIAGSTKLGSYVVLGGQVGIAGHLKLGNQVTVAAQSGVMNDIPDGEKYLGSPAVPDRQAKRQYIGISQLPDLIRRVRDIEKKLDKS